MRKKDSVCSCATAGRDQQFGSGTESMRVNMLAGLLKEQNRPSPEMAVASRQGPYVSVSFHNVFRQALQSAQSSSHQRHSLSQRKRCHAPGWYNLMAVATHSAGQVRLPLNQVQPWAQRTESAEPKKQLWRRAANLSIFSSRTSVSTLRKLCKSKSGVGGRRNAELFVSNEVRLQPEETSFDFIYRNNFWKHLLQ